MMGIIMMQKRNIGTQLHQTVTSFKQMDFSIHLVCVDLRNL